MNSINFSFLFDTQNVEDMGYMFYGCENLKYIDLSYFNLINVTNMNGMLQGYKSLISIVISVCNLLFKNNFHFNKFLLLIKIY